MKLWRVIVAVLVMALVGGAAVFGVPDLSPKLNEIPTTRPSRGDVDVRVYTVGELGPRRSMMTHNSARADAVRGAGCTIAHQR